MREVGHGQIIGRASIALLVYLTLRLGVAQILESVVRIGWGYPDNIGHVTLNGCFRCHDGVHTAKDGSTINADCELCHKQIEAPATSA